MANASLAWPPRGRADRRGNNGGVVGLGAPYLQQRGVQGYCDWPRSAGGVKGKVGADKPPSDQTPAWVFDQHQREQLDPIN